MEREPGRRRNTEGPAKRRDNLVVYDLFDEPVRQEAVRPVRRPASEPMRQSRRKESQRPSQVTAQPARTPATSQRKATTPDVPRRDVNKRPVTPKETPKAEVVKAKKRKSKSKFKKGFLIAWLSFVGVLVAALVVLSVFLSGYEKSRPNKVIQTIVEQIEKGDMENLHLMTEDGLNPDGGDIVAEKADIIAILKDKSENTEESKGISYRILNAESDADKKVYLVKAADTKALKITLEKSDDKHTFGFTGWKEKETQLLPDLFKVTEVMVQIPQDSKLQVNGRDMGREKITAEGERVSILARLMDEGIIGEQPRVDTYTVKGIFLNRDIKHTDSAGGVHDCVYTGNIYSGGFDASEEFIASQRDRVIGMFEPYAFYFTGEAGVGALSQIMLDNSPAYRNATAADVSWMQEHSRVDITDKNVENFKYYSDQVYSCDISFVQTIYQGEEPVKTWDTNMTWVMVKDGDEYYIADFVTKTAEDN